LPSSLPLLSLSPLPITTAVSFLLPSAIVVATTLAIGHCRLHQHWQSQSPLPLAITITVAVAIAESCCLGMARIVFKQFKQIMLTLFYFNLTLGKALIKAG
jgi:hypothetical protein